MKGIPSDRDALFDVGAAGPMLGFLVLIPLTILGISWSYALPPGAIPSDADKASAKQEIASAR